MTWQSMADLAVINRREVTPDERQHIEDVLDAATEVAAGRLPFYEAARIGGIQSPAYTRMLATVTTPKSDPRWHDLMALLDVLITSQGYKICRHGIFTETEVRIHDAGWQYANLDRGAA